MSDLFASLVSVITIPFRLLLWPLSVWFDTWLGFFGIVVGLTLAALYGWRPLRSAIGGYACGLLVVVIVNGLSSPVPCLQDSRGFNILRAYSYDCTSPVPDKPAAAPSK